MSRAARVMAQPVSGFAADRMRREARHAAEMNRIRLVSAMGYLTVAIATLAALSIPAFYLVAFSGGKIESLRALLAALSTGVR